MWEKKDKHLSPEEQAAGELGSQWDHTAIDARTKMVVSLIQGPSRDQETCDRLVEDFANRTNHKPPELVTTDEHAPYQNSLLKTYGQDFLPERNGNTGRKPNPRKRPSEDMVYATVDKTRENGEVVHVDTTLVFGTEEQLGQALDRSPVSANVNTAFVERQNGTARHLNARKQRKTYSFSKQLLEHFAMTWLAVFYYNFCWAHRTLRVSEVGPDDESRYIPRSPAMAARLSDHIWTVEEFLDWQVLGGA
ncbi:MAG: hypothetical protein HY914_00005 [Desulfomonile tiedjei]|nr:hypothetical protein [Desulfomonile tiedjei]